MTQPIEQTFGVRGFHCSGCADNLSAALTRLEGVIRVRADYDTAKVEVRFDPERVGEGEILERIRTTGFEPTPG